MRCFQCGKVIASVTETFAGIAGGALAKRSIHDEEYTGFLRLEWRGPSDLGGRLICLNLVKEEEGKAAQFEYEFCTISCLRSYFNEKLDDLEVLKQAYLEEMTGHNPSP